MDHRQEAFAAQKSNPQKVLHWRKGDHRHAMIPVSRVTCRSTHPNPSEEGSRDATPARDALLAAR